MPLNNPGPYPVLVGRNTNVVRNNTTDYADFISVTLEGGYHEFKLFIIGQRAAGAAQASKARIVTGVTNGGWISGYPTGDYIVVDNDMVFTLGNDPAYAGLSVAGTLYVFSPTAIPIVVQVGQNVAEAVNHIFSGVLSYFRTQKIRYQ